MTRFLLLACLSLLLSMSTAQAQLTEVANTPRVTVTDPQTSQPVKFGIWAYRSPAGDSVVLAELKTNGWYGVWFTMQYQDLNEAIIPAGGVIPYINNVIRPGVNDAFKRRLVTSGIPIPPNTGSAAADAVNLALVQSFKFTVGPDGKSVTLDPK